MKDFAAQYERRIPECRRFTERLEILIKELLVLEQIDRHVVESRTKTTDSFIRKIGAGQKYSDPLAQIKDVCGIRIITYYQDDISCVEKILRREFDVDDENTLVHSSLEAEFGYKSAHYVIRIKDNRLGLPEWSGFGGFVAEVQVRTVLQHAWAAISHKLQYKKEEDAPAELKRKLSRLSALFEIADDEFVALRDASNRVKTKVERALEEGNRDLLLDIVSLGELLRESDNVSEICGIASSIGYVFDGNEDWDQDVTASDTLSDLLKMTEIAGLKTVSDFDFFLNQVLAGAEGYLRAQYESLGGEAVGNWTWYVSTPFIMQLMILWVFSDKYTGSDLKNFRFESEAGEIILSVARNWTAE